MNDGTINRQAAIDAVMVELKRSPTSAIRTKTRLECLPSAQQWIPVSERLPEYGEEVLTYRADDDYDINHVIDEETGEWFYDGVLAWMPLPDPYRGGEQDG